MKALKAVQNTITDTITNLVDNKITDLRTELEKEINTRIDYSKMYFKNECSLLNDTIQRLDARLVV